MSQGEITTATGQLDNAGTLLQSASTSILRDKLTIVSSSQLSM